MSEYGLKIKNIEAATLLGYNNGIRDRYDFTDAMFCNSLFSRFMLNNGLKSYKDEYTRDIICLDFSFGARSYEEEKQHLRKTRDDIKKKDLSQDDKEAKLKILDYLDEKVELNKDLFQKLSKDEIRIKLYEEGISITYENINKRTKNVTYETIHYVMLYRNPSKAKTGQVMFIRKELYNKAYDWLTMGLGKKMPKNNAKIVEMSAYAPLSTSTIVDSVYIPVDDILILKDQDSFFRTTADIVRAKEYTVPCKVVDEEATEKRKAAAIKAGKFKEDGTPKYTKVYKQSEKVLKKCVLETEEAMVKNTLWDGMGICDESVFKGLHTKINGMALFRNHFFKACFLNGKLQLFFKDWCEKNGYDYETYEVKDMFGLSHKLKDIKMVTTDNSIKWRKYQDLMGGDLLSAYEYWKDRIKADGCIWGIVKTDHESKLDGGVQQMSYQMVNTLPCTKEELKDIAQTSVDYVMKLKSDAKEFERFLRKNANTINHYEMLADLYRHNNDFENSKYFRNERKKIIFEYIQKLRKGKITVNGDNLTVFGNPYALLLYSVGDFDGTDPTFCKEEGTIQCYTKRFEDGEYLGAFRNPHNSANNICYLHNVESDELKRYFNLSNNVMAVNCIETDIQARANGMD